MGIMYTPQLTEEERLWLELEAEEELRCLAQEVWEEEMRQIRACPHFKRPGWACDSCTCLDACAAEAARDKD